MNLLSIDIGGTFIKYAILDDDLTILKHWMKPTKKLKDKNEFYDYVCETLIWKISDLLVSVHLV